jgi:hypothetical protein
MSRAVRRPRAVAAGMVIAGAVVVWAASAASGQMIPRAEIVVCNKGDTDLQVATYKVYDTYQWVRAWQHVRPGGCTEVHSEIARKSLVHINEGATVNLAFMARDRQGRMRGYHQPDPPNLPDGTPGLPRIVCLPAANPADGWAVDTRDSAAHMPPCADGTTIVPVSFSAYIQGDFHYTFNAYPRRR